MSVTAAGARCKDIAKRLRQDWAEVKTGWRDENARRFEEDIIAPLLARARAVEDALGPLGAALQQLRRDCE
jgi:hypothetical protein